MKPDQEITLKQQQKIALTPELRQSLLILQKSVTDLETFITQQITENCLLELIERNQEETEELNLTEAHSFNFNDEPDEVITQNHWYEEYERINRSKSSLSLETNSYFHPTLQDYLRAQLHLTSLPPKQLRIAEFFITQIDDDGYLDLNQLHGLNRNTLAEIENGIQLIQTFEPIGVGARNLQECLLIQLRYYWNDFLKTKLISDQCLSHALQIISDHLRDLTDGKMSKIANELHLPIQTVQESVDIIKKLDPKPGRNFGNHDLVPYINPDVIINKTEAKLELIIQEPPNVRLTISPIYRQIIQNPLTDEQTLNYIKDRYNSAQYLIRNIEQRKRTLYQITETLVELQKDFFEKGSFYLKSLTMEEIAERLAIHESTVSRAIQNKYLETPWGIFPFKYFFHSNLDSNHGESISTTKVKTLMKIMIQNELAKSPLSDQKIADELINQGISISRRTVTKYREELMIPNSTKRRRY